MNRGGVAVRPSIRSTESGKPVTRLHSRTTPEDVRIAGLGQGKSPAPALRSRPTTRKEWDEWLKKYRQQTQNLSKEAQVWNLWDIQDMWAPRDPDTGVVLSDKLDDEGYNIERGEGAEHIPIINPQENLPPLLKDVDFDEPLSELGDYSINEYLNMDDDEDGEPDYTLADIDYYIREDRGLGPYSVLGFTEEELAERYPEFWETYKDNVPWQHKVMRPVSDTWSGLGELILKGDQKMKEGFESLPEWMKWDFRKE